MDHGDKVYLMPESYNALRRELHDNWPKLWEVSQWCMAFDGPSFVRIMDNALDMVTQFDTANVDGICKKFLDGLRAKRGLSALHSPSEYGNNTGMEEEVRLAREMNNIAPWKLPPAPKEKQ